MVSGLAILICFVVTGIRIPIAGSWAWGVDGGLFGYGFRVYVVFMRLDGERYGMLGL